MPIPPLPLNALRPFLLLASVAIVLYLLFWLQPVLIPLALAVLLTFVLSPMVTVLHRRRVPRVVAVAVVVLAATAVIAGIAWVVAREVNSLVDSFPRYENNLRNRIAELQAGEAGFLTKVRRAMSRITRQIEETKPPPASPGAEAEGQAANPDTGDRGSRGGHKRDRECVVDLRPIRRSPWEG